MSHKGRKAWNEMYDIMQDHELTPDSYLLKLEVLNLLKKSMPADCTDLDRAIILLIIADSNMSELVEK
jgi:hypothetical protein